MTTENPLHWHPYKIVDIDIGENRTGFVGRAAAMRIDGIEVIVHCRTEADLASVGQALTDGQFDEDRIYKATLIRTEGIEVDILSVPVVPEETIPPVVGDTPVAPNVEGDLVADRIAPETVTLRREDGVPVVQYLGETDQQADDRMVDELRDQAEAQAEAQGDDVDDDGNPVVHGEHEDDEL